MIEIKFLRNEDGGQADKPVTYTYDFKDYMNAALSGKADDIDSAEESLMKQRNKMNEGLASRGVSLNVYIEDRDVMKVYYIPIFKRREEYTSSTPAKLAKGDTDFMQIDGLSSNEVYQNYSDSLGHSSQGGVIEPFNMSDPSIFDFEKDEPKLVFSIGARKRAGYQGPKSAGFKDAKVIGWRKMYMPLWSTTHPDVKDFIYITTDKVAGIMTYATQKLTDAKAMGVIKPKDGDTWHSMTRDVNANNNLALNAGAGAGSGAAANSRAAGAMRETAHYIMKIEVASGQYDGTFDKTGWLPALCSLPLLGLPDLLKKLSGNNGGDTTNNIINSYYENWTANVLPIEFYVLQPSYLQNSQTGYKPGTYLNFSSTYSDWVKQWSSCATLWFYRHDGVVALGAAPYEYKDYEGKGVRINFDGRWSYLPTPPECGGVSGADSYFGKFNFGSRSFSPVAVSADVGEEGAIATESIGKTLETISVPISLSAGSKTPTLKDLEIDYHTNEKNPGAVARLYAMYSMKFFIGYYVYDYNVGKWMQAGDGFWKLYGESF
ncbi:MAG TPA: hypothetical protein DCO86_00215, partial [Spirochaetaceae bacterium]|nr:hypothetical protein [Spirochaetaceae bacterium]